MEEGENLAHTSPTSNPDPDQEQGGLGVWCGVYKSENQKETNSTTFNHPAHCRSRSSTHHTPLNHSKVHPPHVAGWRWRTKAKWPSSQ